MNIPRFLHIPKMSFADPAELIFCTENNVFLNVLKFKSKPEMNVWIRKNENKPVIFRHHEKQNFVLNYRGAKNFIEPDEVISTIQEGLIFYEQIFKREKRLYKIWDEEKLIDYIAKRADEQNITRYRISQITGISEATLSRYFDKSVRLPADRALQICDAVGIKYTFK